MSETVSHTKDDGNVPDEVKRVPLDDQIGALIARIQTLDHPRDATELEAIRRENPAFDAPHDDQDETNWRANMDYNIRRARLDQLTVDDVFDPFSLRDDLKNWLADWYRKRPSLACDENTISALLPIVIETYSKMLKDGRYGKMHKDRPVVAGGLEMLMRKSIALNKYFWAGDPCLANLELN